MNKTPYTLIKLPIQELIRQNYDVTMDQEMLIAGEYLVAQGDSILFDQIEKLRGKSSEMIQELILVVARKNPRQEKDLRKLLEKGFTFNGVHYSRFGKSASQAKEGITAFVCDSMYEELYRMTQMDIDAGDCVISKYEAMRCLVFSSCTLIHDYMPNIVIIGEYEKTLPNQFIKYVAEVRREYIDKETGETKTYQAREIKEGTRDIRLSPFDGCGCHEHEFMTTVSAQLGLDYHAVGTQVRLPFIKGYSVYMPFRKILREWGVESITDIYGTEHPIDTIDCIWNTTMFKGHALFQKTYGENAWNMYQNTLRKYQCKLGISKYSHHTKNLNRYTRMNFQYLQCLDLWNSSYIHAFETKELGEYDILDCKNDGRILGLAKYTTHLFERVIGGDAFYAYKFMGVTDTARSEPDSRYAEAALLNREMLHDPAVRQFLYRKLKKCIDEAKVGKIYCSGFYHTGVGDLIGYLQYAAGKEPVGCLNEHELYSGNFSPGEIVSFRSPLVDSSEVNRAEIVENDLLNKWFRHFKNQDIVMFNLYDISAPQQGGADFDGDIFFLCDDPVIIQAKIDKPVVLDIEDKVTAKIKPYTKEAVIEYEIMTRDNRIGEITNVATSIENRYTTDEKIKKVYEDYASLLRIFQGKEIDFLKTGTRWHMNRGLRKYLKQYPWFLLHNYPEKLEKYEQMQRKNQQADSKEEQIPLTAYHSPSPMNELCHYICAWEKRHILWERPEKDVKEIRPLLIRRGFEPDSRAIMRTCRRYINRYADEIRHHVSRRERSNNDAGKASMEPVIQLYRDKLKEETGFDEALIADYVIYVSYSSLSISKSFAWSAYGDYLLENLKTNTRSGTRIIIREVPDKTDASYEYLGKYYEYREGDANV